MQLFSADAIVFSKIGPDPFISQSSPDHSPELIFHKMKSRDQTSVLLSVQKCRKKEMARKALKVTFVPN